MTLRPLLSHLDESPDAVALQRDGGRAFVSAALRPYVLAALADTQKVLQQGLGTRLAGRDFQGLQVGGFKVKVLQGGHWLGQIIRPG
ncbi:MAG: hypothetical protein ACEQSX_20855, partial [Baekduiaceae bacterium]